MRSGCGVTVASLTGVRSEENYLFILAWNEWAEGNHLEPDQRYGRAFLEATRAVLIDNPIAEAAVAPEPSTAGEAETTGAEKEWNDRAGLGEVAANVAGLLGEFPLPAGRRVVDLAEQQFATSKTPAQEFPGVDVVPATFTDVASLKATLDAIDSIGALLLIDVLEHLAEPQELLTSLASWSLDHGSPQLLVVAPNVAHVDMALQVLCGRFELQEAGPSLRRTCASSPRTRCSGSWTVRGGALSGDTTSIPSTPSSTTAGCVTACQKRWWERSRPPPSPSIPIGPSPTSSGRSSPHAVDMAPSTYGEAVAPGRPRRLTPTIDPKVFATVAEFLGLCRARCQ